MEEIYNDFGERIGLIIGLGKKEIYTQLAKEGRFDELPDTCEFSEPVELEVWDNDKSKDFRRITGKFKGNYMDIHCIGWQFAKLLKPKIDLSDFKVGDVVEVETENFGTFYGMIHTINQRGVTITFGKQSGTLRMITDVKSIKKIK